MEIWNRDGGKNVKQQEANTVQVAAACLSHAPCQIWLVNSSCTGGIREGRKARSMADPSINSFMFCLVQVQIEFQRRGRQMATTVALERRFDGMIAAM